MIAIDTNVLLRLIVADDAPQLEIARELVFKARVFVPLTVTLECERVLRSFYKYPRRAIADAISATTQLDSVTFEQIDGVRWALRQFVAGADFADMIHLLQAAAARVSSFATFDDGIADKAGPGTPLPIEALA